MAQARTLVRRLRKAGRTDRFYPVKHTYCGMDEFYVYDAVNESEQFGGYSAQEAIEQAATWNAEEDLREKGT